MTKLPQLQHTAYNHARSYTRYHQPTTIYEQMSLANHYAQYTRLHQSRSTKHNAQVNIVNIVALQIKPNKQIQNKQTMLVVSV